MIPTAAYAAQSPTASLAPFAIQRRDVGPHDVQIEILFCGVCHTDVHVARGEWVSTFPVVPGHEIVGRVAAVGAHVSRHKVGDVVGVGCLVDSCRSCPDCQEGLEQFCATRTLTYNAPDRVSGGHTFGGYSRRVVVDENFVLRIPPNLDLAGAAPLLCAGITTYSPLRHWKVGPGMRVGVVGLGGLGHMAVKLARAMGADVTVLTTSPGKAADALALGASEVIISSDADQMAAKANSFDFILNTVAAAVDLNPYLALLRRDGTMTMLGVPGEPNPPVLIRSLLSARRSLAASPIGGLPETQEMLDFCGEHGITADIEMIDMADINTAYERMLKGDVKYRFVIDLATLPEQAAA